jgi:hypothetical protein
VRYLYRVHDGAPFAYERSRRNFCLVSDGTLWAHESHGLLLSATTSVALLHRIGAKYYDPETGVALYVEGAEPGSAGLASPSNEPPVDAGPSPSAARAKHRRAGQAR